MHHNSIIRNFSNKTNAKSTPLALRKKYPFVLSKTQRISTAMSAAALIQVANSTAPPFPCFTTTRARRKPFLRNSLVIAKAEDQSSTETPPPESVARRLILLRHASSSWENRSLRDHDRPLNDFGRTDAVKLSQKLEQLGWIPELILSSDAQRTRETLKIMHEQVRAFLEAEVHFISSFYSVAAMDGQTAEHLQQAICKYSTDKILTIMCMGHNKGWEEAASMLSGASIELKTCNAALLEATGKTWEEAFRLAGFGGWKLHRIIKPNTDI